MTADVERMREALEELAAAAERDMKANQGLEEEPGGWWSLRTEAAILHARALLSLSRGREKEKDYSAPAGAAPFDPDLIIHRFDAIKALQTYAFTMEDANRLVLSIAPNGKITFGEGFTADEASKKAAEMLAAELGRILRPERSAARSEHDEALSLADTIINRLPANGENWSLIQRYNAARSEHPEAYTVCRRCGGEGRLIHEVSTWTEPVAHDGGECPLCGGTGREVGADA